VPQTRLRVLRGSNGPHHHHALGRSRAARERRSHGSGARYCNAGRVTRGNWGAQESWLVSHCFCLQPQGQEESLYVFLFIGSRV